MIIIALFGYLPVGRFFFESVYVKKFFICTSDKSVHYNKTFFFFQIEVNYLAHFTDIENKMSDNGFSVISIRCESVRIIIFDFEMHLLSITPVLLVNLKKKIKLVIV